MTTGVSLSSLRNSLIRLKPARPVPMTTMGSMTASCIGAMPGGHQAGGATHTAPRECRPASGPALASDFDHLEVVLAVVAIRADPVIRHVFPGSTRRDALFRQTFGFVIDKATYHTFPLTHA